MLSREMSSFARRTALVSIAALVACGPSDQPDTGSNPIGDALSPKHPEMIEPFTGMDLQVEAPPRPEALAVKQVGAGSGEAVHYGMIARVHYIASLANGKIFHSTYKGDDAQPTVVRLMPPAVPEGLALGLDGCVVGERRVIRMPSDLAYGDQPNYDHDTVVPAHSSLVYDVEVVEVVRDLSIKILTEGAEGPVLQHGQSGKFHYIGVLASDGSEFDATSPGQPQVLSLTGVIAGWQLGLPGMKVGEKRRLMIPAALAYGEAGRPPKIGANADLVFDIELAEIMP